jgi:hypothetical protein
MDQNSAGITYLKNRFPEINDAKIKEQVFVGSQTGELIQDVKFEDQLCEMEKTAWKSFTNITTNFGVNLKAERIVIW